VSADRRFGLTLLVVPTDSEGFGYGPQAGEDRSARQRHFRTSFTDVKVPVGNVLGEVGKGIELDDAHELSGADAAKIKLFCTETAARVIDKCLQLHGGYGYMLVYPIDRLYAETRVSRIYGGTSEVMKTIIAKDLAL
jgi:alkylation response protein AidB-like acyl-CoA dehydrogenase